jgi:glycine dehydrogenase subunit 1
MRGFLPHTPDEIEAMLGAVGVESIEDLFATVPADCRWTGPLELPPGEDEYRVGERIGALADMNRPAGGRLNFMGGGAYDRIQPAVMAQVLARPEFYSAYTPYQPEVSQGTLQVIFEFQTLMARLTGMAVANASLYDGASALAEAALLAGAATKRHRILLPANLSPGCRRVVATYAEGQELELVTLPWSEDGGLDPAAVESALAAGEVAALVVQSPNHFGVVEDLGRLAPLAKRAGALLLVHADPSSLGVLEAPGHYGADVVTGEGQSLGLPLSFGGPYLGVIGVSRELVRRLPGRLVGRTVDGQGRPGFVLTLQTREQHIRREKATSNICTNQGLMALAATVYLATLGERGLVALGEGLANRAGTLAARAAAVPGFRVPFGGDIFQEFVLEAPVPATTLMAAARERGIAAGLPLGEDFPALGENALLVTVSEKHGADALDRYVDFLKEFAR